MLLPNSNGITSALGITGEFALGGFEGWKGNSAFVTVIFKRLLTKVNNFLPQ